MTEETEIQKVLDKFAQKIDKYNNWKELVKDFHDYDQRYPMSIYSPKDLKELASLAFAQGKLSERKEITELMEDVLSQACYEKDEKGEDVYFSRALSAYADGLKWLVETGKYEHVYKPVGRMVKIRLKSQLKEGVKK